MNIQLNNHLRISESFIDDNYCLAQNLAIKFKEITPYNYYISMGWKEDYAPNPLFDPAIYKKNHTTPLAMPALIHYLGTGRTAKINPHPLFLRDFYCEQYDEKIFLNTDPLIHYLESGVKDHTSPHPLFDHLFYSNQIKNKTNNKDLYGLDHYLHIGWKQQLNPHPFFDTNYYLKKNPDVVAEGVNPLLHFVTKGIYQGRNPHPSIPEQVIPKLSNTIATEDWKHLLIHFLSIYSLVSLIQWRFNQETVNNICSDLRLNNLLNIAETKATSLKHLIHEVQNLAKNHTTNSHYDASIIIPVKDNLIHTLGCLRSIFLSSSNHYSFEIIIGDDGSKENNYEALLCLETSNLKVLRNHKSLGFLENCNKAAKESSGKYLILLNNDTIVFPNWLDEIVNTFINNSKVGLVGSMLINPDGSLQEAGGIVWKDAYALNVGRGDDPRKPCFSYLRQVDYCSGAAIAIRSSLWSKLHGFDIDFAPAYYEDTDLAFRVRESGYLTVVQPLSWVLHFEGVSHGKSLATGIKKHQEVNRQLFFNKWYDTLSSHPTAAPDFDFQFTGISQKSILVIDHQTPMPDHDSGSIDTYLYIKCLIAYGLHVIFVPNDFQYKNRYTESLLRLGVECLYSPYIDSVEKAYLLVEKRVSAILAFRFNITEKWLPIIKKNSPNKKIILESVDIHYLRALRHAEISRSSSDLSYALKIKNQELSVINSVDATIILSDYEYQLIKKEAPIANLFCIPIPREINVMPEVALDERKNILFVGGFKHHPNVDGITWFITEIWPKLQLLGFDQKLIIIGSDTPQDVYDLESKSIEVKGFVEDITPFLSQCRATIAPLRYGAGLKGKVIESLRYGIPCVSTEVGVEGSGILHNIHALVANDPDTFAIQIMRLLNDDVLWKSLSKNCMNLFERKFSSTAVYPKIFKLLQSFDI